MPASLEDLPPEAQAQLNLGKLVHTMLKDPKLSTSTKRLLKQKNPDLVFPELEVEDAVAKVREETSEQLKTLQDALDKQNATKALEAEDAKITEAGLDPKVVREFMTKNGIVNVDVVIELFQSRDALAEPSTDSIGPFRFKDASPEDLAAMWKNPVAWREKKAYEILGEMRAKQRPQVRRVG